MTQTLDQTLDQALAAVHDRDSFIVFLELWAEDRARSALMDRETQPPPYASGALGWENGSIETFFDAAAACARATWPENIKDNPWREAAEIIYGGKVYE